MGKILTKKFFERPALRVARDLVGKFLVLRRRTSKLAFMITETEAYIGPQDKASHAHSGKTARNAPMFGEAGRWYVYFTYGMHWMLNIVTGPKDYPAAVLIRGVSGTPFSAQHFVGYAYLAAAGLLCSPRRAAQCPPKYSPQKELDGPAKLTKFLKIDKHFNDKLASRATGLWIAAPSGRASLRARGFWSQHVRWLLGHWLFGI